MKTKISEALSFLHDNLESLTSNLVPLWHPLGFVSCVIDEVPPSHVVRVHYWPAGERRVKNPDWPIHTHTYALESLVLAGKVRDMQYRAQPGSQWCVYSVSYYNGGSEIIRTPEEVDTIVEVDQMRNAGHQYEVPRGVYHQTLVPQQHSAVTLVLLTDHSSEAPKVLGSKMAEKYPYDRISFDRHRFWGVVKAALECHLTNADKGRS
jgi:hypothetical protein